MYCLTTAIEPTTLTDGRVAWNLSAYWREPDGHLAAQRHWGPYVRLALDVQGRSNLADNRLRFAAKLADGPDWRELDAENDGILADIVGVARQALNQALV